MQLSIVCDNIYVMMIQSQTNKTHRAEFEGSVDIILVFLNFLPEPHGLVIFHRVDILGNN